MKRLKLLEERAFVDYCFLIGLSARLDGENEHWDALFKAVMDKHFEALIKSGLDRKKAAETLEKIAHWHSKRDFSVQIFVIQDAPEGPTYQVNFVDELEKDPDFKIMKQMMKQAGSRA